MKLILSAGVFFVFTLSCANAQSIDASQGAGVEDNSAMISAQSALQFSETRNPYQALEMAYARSSDPIFKREVIDEISRLEESLASNTQYKAMPDIAEVESPLLQVVRHSQAGKFSMTNGCAASACEHKQLIIVTNKEERPLVSESEKKPPLLGRLLEGLLGIASGDRHHVPVPPAPLPTETQDNSNAENAEQLYAKDQFIVRLKPGLSFEEILQTLDERNLEAIEAYDSFGMLLVELDSKKVFEDGIANFTTPRTQANFPTDLTLKDLQGFSVDNKLDFALAQSAYLKESENITDAMANFAMSGDQTTPSGVTVPASIMSSPDPTAWWVDQVMPSQIRLSSVVENASISIGVIDTGFNMKSGVRYNPELARDKNTKMKPMGESTHGGRVSEIICEMIPSCDVHPYAVSIALVENTRPESVVTGVAGSFEDQQAAIKEEKKAEVSSKLAGHIFKRLNDISKPDRAPFKAVSISLGANWVDGQSVNYTLSEATKDAIGNSGNMLGYLYSMLSTKQMAIFLSAGNDSTENHTLESKYNSPFHYAAVKQWKAANLTAVVIEAHDADGKRLVRSNNGGMFSCPSPVFVGETLSDSRWKDLSNATGLKDQRATSYSTPVCASAFVMLATYLNDWPVSEILNYCLEGDSQASGSATANFNSLVAANKCRQGDYKANKFHEDRCIARANRAGFAAVKDVRMICKL